MQQVDVEAESVDNRFAVKCRFIQYYFNYDWEKSFQALGGLLSSGNPSAWKQRNLTGDVWEAVLLRLGYPQLSYSGNGTNDELRVHRNVIGGEARMLAVKQQRMNTRQILKVSIAAGAGDRSFTMKVRGGLQSHLEYMASDGFLRLRWEGSADFEFSAGLSNSASLLREYFNTNKTMLLRRLDNPYSAHMRDVRVNMRALPDNDSQYLVIGVLPGSVADAFIPETYPLSIASNVNLGFNEGIFTNVQFGQAPVDKNWVLGLFLPDGHWHAFQGVEKYEEKFYRCSYGYGSGPAQVIAADGVNAELQISPAAQVFSPCAERVLLEVTPASANVRWALEGEKQGSLEHDGSRYYYKPPADVTPAAAFDENTELLVAPAYRTSVESPVVYDNVKVESGSNVAQSMFVTFMVPTTHVIKAFRHGDTLRLELWYFDRKQQKVMQVPSSDITWMALGGEGAVSPEGVFTAGTACSMVVGIDERMQTTWGWGATILPYPLIDLDSVLAFLSGETE